VTDDEQLNNQCYCKFLCSADVCVWRMMMNYSLKVDVGWCVSDDVKFPTEFYGHIYVFS
ncbi:hypothetical protein THOM_1968, partial [Trachipleistophora hominis]